MKLQDNFELLLKKKLKHLKRNCGKIAQKFNEILKKNRENSENGFRKVLKQF